MKHIVILVPGLGDRLLRHRWFTSKWESDGIEVYIHIAPWNNTKESLTPKLNRLVKRIDELYAKGYKVSLVGTSAGGSLVINAYFKRKSKIHKVISVCGRMQAGKNVFPTLKQATRNFTAFATSVRTCEDNLQHLSKKDKEKIMAVRPWPFDGIVPMSCIPIDGAKNITVPIPFHGLGIGGALSICRKPLIDFILC